MRSLELTKGCEPKSWASPIWRVFGLYIIANLFTLSVSYFSNYSKEETTLLIGIVLCILVIYFSRKNEKRSLGSFGIHKEYLFKKYLLGMLIGTGLIGATLLLDRIMGDWSVGFNKDISNKVMVIYTVILLFQTMAEEIIFRGYMQNAIATIKGKKFGVIAQAVLFALFHIGTKDITFLNMITLFLVALFLGIVFWYTDSIFTVSGIHFVWNFVLIVILGYDPSGNTGFLFSVSVRDSIFFENKLSVLDPSIIVMLVFLAILYYMLKKKNFLRARY